MKTFFKTETKENTFTKTKAAFVKLDKTIKEMVTENFEMIYASYEDDLTIRFDKKDKFLTITNMGIVSMIHYDIVKDMKQSDIVNVILTENFL